MIIPDQTLNIAKFQIDTALEHIPHEYRKVITRDVYKRIGDWLASGGEPTDPYIQSQVGYAKRAGELFRYNRGY